jgi:hypothetical protein
MRSSAYKIALILTLLGSQAIALELSKFERTCSEIGFKPKTPAFGECVLELHGRESKSNLQPAPVVQPTQPKISQNTTPQGDGTPDHATCAKYGFQAGTTEYAQCRMQIDTARTQARQQQNEYEQQLAAQKKAKEEAQGEALFLLGMGMLSGSAPKRSNNNSSFIQPPQPDRIYNLPGGKFMRCSTLGMVTNCQ